MITIPYEDRIIYRECNIVNAFQDHKAIAWKASTFVKVFDSLIYLRPLHFQMVALFLQTFFEVNRILVPFLLNGLVTSRVSLEPVNFDVVRTNYELHFVHEHLA